MKRLPWLLVALLPAAFGFFDTTKYQGSPWPFIALIFAFCFTGSFFMFGALKPMWVRVFAAISLAVVLFVVDVSVGVFIGCTIHPVPIAP